MGEVVLWKFMVLFWRLPGSGVYRWKRVRKLKDNM